MRAREPDEQGHVVTDGVRIAWERFGDRGPWILFVPTWHIVHSRASKMQVAHLARRFRVLTFDPRGNGLSDRPQSGYRIEDHAGDALAVLDRHGVERAALIRASQGANAALWLALEQPARVERLVLIGAAVGTAISEERVAFIRRDYEAFIQASSPRPSTSRTRPSRSRTPWRGRARRHPRCSRPARPSSTHS